MGTCLDDLADFVYRLLLLHADAQPHEAALHGVVEERLLRPLLQPSARHTNRIQVIECDGLSVLFTKVLRARSLAIDQHTRETETESAQCVCARARAQACVCARRCIAHAVQTDAHLLHRLGARRRRRFCLRAAHWLSLRRARAGGGRASSLDASRSNHARHRIRCHHDQAQTRRTSSLSIAFTDACASGRVPPF